MSSLAPPAAPAQQRRAPRGAPTDFAARARTILLQRYTVLLERGTRRAITAGEKSELAQLEHAIRDLQQMGPGSSA